MDAVADVSGLPLVFPAHPRTAARLDELGIVRPSSVLVVEPMGYLDFIGLVDGAAVALTDSGGVQEATSVLGVPCVTLRANTERPVTCEFGTNRLAGADPSAVSQAGSEALVADRSPGTIPLWDGSAERRIAAILRVSPHSHRATGVAGARPRVLRRPPQHHRDTGASAAGFGRRGTFRGFTCRDNIGDVLRFTWAGVVGLGAQPQQPVRDPDGTLLERRLLQ